MKKLALLAIVLLSAFSLPARASRQDEITMLVMPEDRIPLQVAQDISRRYPVLLVSYRLVYGELKLYAWNDETWVSVPVEDYANGTFFANRPGYAIVVEHERFHAPAILTPNSIWCESASRLSSTDPRVLLHLLGLHFDFPFRYWNQLAKRYGYALEEINPTLENVHWWNIRGDELVEKRAKRDFALDMDKWHYLEPLPPPPIEPVRIEKEPVITEVEKPATEPAAGAVNITVKAPEPKVEKTPVAKPVVKPGIKTETPASKPFPSLKPEPVIKPAAAVPAPAVEKAPALEPAPAPAATTPIIKPEPVIESIPTIEPVPAPLIEAPSIAPTVEIEKAVQAEVPAPAPLVTEVDPFATGEVPAAEIVVPQPPKKPWWKF